MSETRQRCIEAARRELLEGTSTDPVASVVDAVFAQLRTLGPEARMAGGRSLLAGDVGPEVDAADPETLEAYASDFEQAWRAAVDAMQEGSR